MGQTNDRESTRKQGTRVAQRFNKARFVQRELTAQESAALKALPTDAGALLEHASELTSQGYKITIRWDDYTDAVAAWLVAPEDGGRNAGCILPARGSTAVKALKQLFFKHWELLREDWSGDLERRGVDALDD